MVVVAAAAVSITTMNAAGFKIGKRRTSISMRRASTRHRSQTVNKLESESDQNNQQQLQDEEDQVKKSLGVEAALSMLRFYKTGEISPLLPNSCRYVPTCSEYSMEAYKKYGVVKGTVLTAWRVCRCNPLGNASKSVQYLDGRGYTENRTSSKVENTSDSHNCMMSSLKVQTMHDGMLGAPFYLETPSLMFLYLRLRFPSRMIALARGFELSKETCSL
ncbi:unnamed protein product [Dovyalis caffra]|uniref:Membrane protein insertion efficiency factor n=1 Tax=Dovyalis caffra TaxID=77055 RepID=A0AAV1RDQ9_9ROSI|nr:unnamed protein product [Dovyalis caffra]